MDDATLDQFAGGDDAPAESDAADGESQDAGDGAVSGDGDAETDTGNVDEDDGTAVSPAVSTFAWVPDGAACVACGVAVERRWRREAGLVCEDCVDWE